MPSLKKARSPNNPRFSPTRSPEPHKAPCDRDEVLVANNTLKSNYELVCLPQFRENGMEIDFKGEFLNVAHPKRSPYTPDVLPPIRNEHSRLMYMWVTAYTINTVLFAINQSGFEQYIFYSKDLPDNVPVKLNTNAFIFVVPPLYYKYPDKDMAIGYRMTSPAKVTLNPDEGTITMFGKMKFFVILDKNRLVDCFTLNVVGEANIDSVLIFRKENYSYIGLKMSNSRTHITLLESHIGDFDLTLLRMTVDILSQFILLRYISPKMEEGFPLPLPKNIALTNSDTAIGKSATQTSYSTLVTNMNMEYDVYEAEYSIALNCQNYILILTDFEINRH